MLLQIFCGVTALILSSDTAAFTIHPRNFTIDTLHDQIVDFTCRYTTTNVQPQWLVVAEGGLPQALSFRENFGLYSYHTATPTLAQVSVRALTGTPGLNNTCFSCRFINTVILESRRGCLIIACELQLQVAVCNTGALYWCVWLCLLQYLFLQPCPACFV